MQLRQLHSSFGAESRKHCYRGATTLTIVAFSTTTLDLKTFNRSRKNAALNIMTRSIMTRKIMTFNVYAEICYDECH
jgi:hypothetical protein